MCPARLLRREQAERDCGHQKAAAIAYEVPFLVIFRAFPMMAKGPSQEPPTKTAPPSHHLLILREGGAGFLTESLLSP